MIKIVIWLAFGLPILDVYAQSAMILKSISHFPFPHPKIVILFFKVPLFVTFITSNNVFFKLSLLG